MTDEQMRDLVKECGLDWHRGYMPLFDGDPTNRYAVLIEAVETAERERWTRPQTPGRSVNGDLGAATLADGIEELERLRAEVTAWKSFARSCQVIVAAVQTHLSPEQNSAFLSSQIHDGITRLGSSDTSDVDPELLEYARKVLDGRFGPNVRAKPGATVLRCDSA